MMERGVVPGPGIKVMPRCSGWSRCLMDLYPAIDLCWPHSVGEQRRGVAA